MDVYVYRGALLCRLCGADKRAELAAQGKAPPDPADESLYDSDEFPKGPYGDGGGESDCPEHCDFCSEFLDNPLTSDGYEYVWQEIGQYLVAGHGSREVLRQWVDSYFLDLRERLSDDTSG